MDLRGSSVAFKSLLDTSVFCFCELRQEGVLSFKSLLDTSYNTLTRHGLSARLSNPCWILRGASRLSTRWIWRIFHILVGYFRGGKPEDGLCKSLCFQILVGYFKHEVSRCSPEKMLSNPCWILPLPLGPRCEAQEDLSNPCWILRLVGFEIEHRDDNFQILVGYFSCPSRRGSSASGRLSNPCWILHAGV